MKHQTNPAIAVNRMREVFNNFKDVTTIGTYFSDCFNEHSETEERPVIIGHLNTDYGYVAYKPIPKGTTVYRIKDCDFFEIEHISSGAIHRQRFYKGALDKHIDKLT